MQDEDLTIEQAARLMQIEELTVRAWMKEGLPYREQDGVIVIRHADLDAYLASQNQGAARDAAQAG